VRRVALLAVAFAATPAGANPLDAFGFGPRGTAMGGAVAATADDVSATYYNPAGLAAGDTLRIELGYTRFEPALELNGAVQDIDPSAGLQGGFVLPGVIGGHRLGVGLGVHLPDARVTRLRALRQSMPRFELYDNRPQRLSITSGLGFELLPGLSIGAALTYLSGTEGTLEVGGVVHASDEDRTRLFSGLDVNLKAVRYPSFGLRYCPTRAWCFGVTERERFELALDLDVDVRGRIVSGNDESVVVEEGRFFLNSRNADLFSPRQVALAAAWSGPNHTLEADLTWLQWSGFPGSTATIVIDLDLGTFDYVVPIPDPPGKPAYHDVWVPRLGGELRAHGEAASTSLWLRGGAFFEPSPAPAQPGLGNSLDADKLGLSAGIAVELPDPWGVFPQPLEIGLSALWVGLVERRYQKASAADGAGDVVVSGHVLGGSASVDFRF
jgi:long-chain fatty acid transport protein